MARYALVIGIGTNILPLRSLSKTVGDAAAIADLLEQSGNFFSVERLIGEVNQRKLEDAFQRLLQKQAAKNEAVIYYTGHGFPLVNDSGDEQVYLAPSDCRITVKDGQVIQQEKGILLKDVNSLIGDATLSNLVVLLECCYSGALLANDQLRQTMTAFPSTDYFLIAACREFETAYALKKSEHSIFTTALLKALHLEKNDRAEVTTWRLFDAIYRDLRGSGQEPFCMGGGRSITFLTPIAQVANETCPYQGLLAFTPETEQFFFGRDMEIAKLIEQLQVTNFVPVIGASGSGKSSVVLAGLVPSLQRQGWRVLEPMKPGDSPVAKLKEAIAPLFPAQDCDNIFHLIDEQGLTPVIRKLAAEERVLLVVDQFEEVFTLCTDQQKRDRFIQLLTTCDSPNLAIVLTLRADFFDPYLSYGRLTQAIQHHAVFLEVLEGENLEAAIVKPAAKQGYRLEGRLLQALLEDVEAEQNCLPLLQFVLEKLWEERDTQRRELTLERYRQLGRRGRIKGALDSHAEDVYRVLAAREQGEWVRRVMLKLVRTGDGNSTRDTRQRRNKSEFLEMGTDAASRQAIESVIASLVDQRLLVSNLVDRKDTSAQVNEQHEVDLIHEALMQGWERFDQWREQDRDTRRLIQELEAAQREWKNENIKNHKEAKRYFLEGRLLQDAKQLLKTRKDEFSETLQTFIHRSLLWQRRKRLRLASWLVIPAVSLMVIVESALREETVKQNYVSLSNPNTQREAITALVKGCLAARQYPWIPSYFRERVSGNCRQLQGIDLQNADLTGVNISGVTLVNVNLSGARLDNANLIGAIFYNVDLSDANLNNAKLMGFFISPNSKTTGSASGTTLVPSVTPELVIPEDTDPGADLRGADLRGADLRGAVLSGANLSNAILFDANLSYSVFGAGSNLRGAKLRGANLSNSFLTVVDLTNADLSYVNLAGAKLSVGNASEVLGGSNLSNASLFTSNLIGADLSYTNLRHADLSHANLHGTNLIGADLSFANLNDVKVGCSEVELIPDGKQKMCTNLKDIKWNENTIWKSIKNWDEAENIPPALKQQLEAKRRVPLSDFFRRNLTPSLIPDPTPNSNLIPDLTPSSNPSPEADLIPNYAPNFTPSPNSNLIPNYVPQQR